MAILHYSSTTGSKTAPEHRWYSVLRFESLTITPPDIYPLSLLPYSSIFVSSDHKICLFEQQQLLEELEGVDFGVGVSFLVGSLSVHGNVKRTPLWTVMLVYQFPVHGRLEALGLFLNIVTSLTTASQFSFSRLMKIIQNLLSVCYYLSLCLYFLN